MFNPALEVIQKDFEKNGVKSEVYTPAHIERFHPRVKDTIEINVKIDNLTTPFDIDKINPSAIENIVARFVNKNF